MNKFRHPDRFILVYLHILVCTLIQIMSLLGSAAAFKAECLRVLLHGYSTLTLVTMSRISASNNFPLPSYKVSALPLYMELKTLNSFLNKNTIGGFKYKNFKMWNKKIQSHMLCINIFWWCVQLWHEMLLTDWLCLECCKTTFVVTVDKGDKNGYKSQTTSHKN